MTGQLSHPSPRPLAVIIESDSLTLWSLHCYLASSFDLELVSCFEEALPHLQRPELRCVICGSPIVDSEPGALQELAKNTDNVVIALVSDTSQSIPGNIMVVEKPFALEQLAKLLNVHNAGAGG